MTLFNFVKSRVSILDVVSEYATLKKTGIYAKGICPFHHEKTPSFTVSPHREIFYCFGCHSGGDVIAFISKAEQCSPLEAALYLVERYNLELPSELQQQTKLTEKETDKRKQYWLLCAAFADWCHQQLKKNSNVGSFLKDRNIKPETIDLFNLGYFPNTSGAIKNLIDYMKQRSFLVHDLLEFNILAEGKNMFFSPLTERIIFPIKDHLGRSCGFGGRIYKKMDERPKYYNCKENEYFSKGTMLFGFDLAKKAIQEKNSVFLVEGYIDCIMMTQFGYRNTIASLGTACTVDQLKLIARYSSELIVVYDGDEAGQKAMLRLTELCWQVNLELKIIQLPRGYDPDSWLNKEYTLDPLIAQAQDIFSFFLRLQQKGFQSRPMADKLEIVRTFLAIIEKIPDNLKRDLLLQQASIAFDIPVASLQKELFRAQSGQFSPENHQKTEEKDPSDMHISNILKKITVLEKKLFSVIINNINLIKDSDLEYLLEYLPPAMSDLLKKLLDSKGDGAHIEFIQFYDTLSEQEKLFISHLVLECQEIEEPKQLDYLMMQFQKKTWKTFVANTKIKLNRAQQMNNEIEVNKILNNFQDLKKKLISKGLI